MPKRAAVMVGYTEWAPERNWSRPMFGMEAAAELAFEALADAGVEKDEVDGLVFGGLQESPLFAPLAMAEYLGIQGHFGEVVDLGGATSAAMIVRAAMAIEVGLADKSVTMFQVANLAARTKTQNVYRKAIGLPPLPDLTTVTHDAPAVAEQVESED